MPSLPNSIFLDTNIFILGAESDESKILSLLECEENRDQQTKVIQSQNMKLFFMFQRACNYLLQLTYSVKKSSSRT